MILQILCTHAHNYVWTVARQRAKQHACAPTIHRESQRSLTRTTEELVGCFVLALPQIVSAARIYLCKTSRKTLVTLPQSTLCCSLLLLYFVSHLSQIYSAQSFENQLGGKETTTDIADKKVTKFRKISNFILEKCCQLLWLSINKFHQLAEQGRRQRGGFTGSLLLRSYIYIFFSNFELIVEEVAAV